MSKDRRIEYEPNIEFTPEAGDSTSGVPAISVPYDDSYADRDEALRLLNEVIDRGEALIEDIRTRLRSKSVLIRNTERESALLEALAKEWPEELNNAAPRKIPFDFYLAVRARSPISAKYVAQAYEKMARDINGSSELDVHNLVEIIVNEAKRHREHILQRIHSVVAPIEHRMLEIAQDFADEAIGVVVEAENTANNTYQPESREFDDEEIRRYLTHLKIKNNEYSSHIKIGIEDIRTKIVAHDEKFWDKVIPGTFYASKRVVSGINRTDTELDRIVGVISSQLQDRHQTALVDASRRSRSLLSNARAIFDTVRKTVVLRTYHRELVQLGNIKPEGTLDWVDSAPTEEEHQAFLSPPAPPPSIFSAPHKDTTNKDEDDHGIYLRHDGARPLSGNLTVSEGVSIDGVRIGQHTHSAPPGQEAESDDAPQIPGSSIQSGTLTTDAIDTNVLPEAPNALSVASQSTVVSPDGSRSTGIELAWEGPEQYAYQLQLVPSSSIGAVTVNKPRLHEAMRVSASDNIPKRLLPGERYNNVPASFLGRVKGLVVFSSQETTAIRDAIYLTSAKQGSYSSWADQLLYNSTTTLKSPTVVLRPDGNGWLVLYKYKPVLTIGGTGYERLVIVVRKLDTWLAAQSVLSEEVQTESQSADPPQMFCGYNRQTDLLTVVNFRNNFTNETADVIRTIDKAATVTTLDFNDLGGTGATTPCYTTSAGANTHFLYGVDDGDPIAKHIVVDTSQSPPTVSVVNPPYGGADSRWVAANADKNGYIHAILWPPGAKEEDKGADFEHWIYNGTSWDLITVFSEGY